MPYETILLSEKSQSRFKVQGVGYAEIHIQVTPSEARDVQIDTESVSSEIPAEFLRGFVEGIMECASEGVIAGNPIKHVKVKLLNVGMHRRDSNGESFKRSAYDAFRWLLRGAHPVVVDE